MTDITHAPPTPPPPHRWRALVDRLKARAFGGPSGNVFRGMATLALGSGTARLIGLAAIPVLTRIYSPEDYGVLAVFTAFVAMLAPVLTLRYVIALPLPRHDGMAINLLALAAALTAFFTLVLTLVLGLFGTPVFNALSMQALAPWWWLIVIALVGTALYEMMSMWATRARAYKLIARTQIIQAVAGDGSKIALGLLGLMPLGLLIGQVIKQSAGTINLAQTFWTGLRRHARQIRPDRMIFAARRYAGFPAYRLPSQFLLVLSTKAPLLFVAAMYDAETTGQLGLALMALAVPVGLLGQTMSQAFYAEGASVGRKSPDLIRRLAHSTIKRLLLLSLLPALALLLFGEMIFTLAFGPAWQLAGTFASVLAIYLVFQFLQKPMAHLFFIFEAQRQLLFLNIQRATLIAACFATAYFLQIEAVTTVLFYSIAISAHYALSVYWALRIIPKERSHS